VYVPKYVYKEHQSINQSINQCESKNVKFYSNLKSMYFPNAFFTILHASLATIFIYCWRKSCSWL